MKSENSDNGTFATARKSGQRMGRRILPSLEHFSTQQTSPPVETGSICRRSLHRRWKHEIQIALLQRRAAMARAVLPNPSVRAEASSTEPCTRYHDLDHSNT